MRIRRLNTIPSCPWVRGVFGCGLALLALSALADSEVQGNNRFPGPLNLTERIQPLEPRGIYREEAYFCWGPNLIRGDDGRYYMVYSRWPRAEGWGAWLTHSEIALAVSDDPEGPYEHVKVLLRGRGEGHWDELMAHNPKIKRFDGRYYLYYISSQQGPTRGHIRDSQRTGVAVSDNLTGPYERFEEPLLQPGEPVHNRTVNPAITQMPDGRYLLIVKGDIHPKKPAEPMPQRVQGLAIGDSPTGPFELQPEAAIADIDTEDASLWYDSRRQQFHAVFHAHKHIGLITSPDGKSWTRTPHYKVTDKTIELSDASQMQAGRLERPSVYVEQGEPRILSLAFKKGNDSSCLLVPLRAE